MIAKGSPSVSLEDIQRKYTDFDIAHRYLGITCVPEVIVSPLRQDRNPSLSIFESHSSPGTLMFRDFGTGEHGNLYTLLMKLWNVSYHKMLARILDDMPESVELKRNRIKVYRKSVKKVEVKVREWRQYDLDWWQSFGISLPWLKFGDIYPISHIIITKEGQAHVFPAEKYAYVYVERKDGNISLKIYQPLSTEYKWISKHDSSVWDLWTKIPERGENLIITSSRKDALCIWANTGIPSLSLQGEGYIPKEHVVQQLKDRFANIYILYDNDFMSEENHGRMYGKAIAEKFGLTQIEIPEKWGSKDSSDLYHNHGAVVLRNVIYSLVKPNKNTEK